jgi:transposase
VPAKKYPDELRLQALQLYLHSSPRPSVRRLAEQLGVHPDALRYWIRRARSKLAGDDPERSTLSDELERLHKENADLRRAVEVLKKANLCLADQVDQAQLRS